MRAFSSAPRSSATPLTSVLQRSPLSAARPLSLVQACPCQSREPGEGFAQRSVDFALLPTRGDTPLQAKLFVGGVRDPLEAEADRIADQVVSAPQTGAAPSVPHIHTGSAATPVASRKCTACQADEQDSPTVQRSPEPGDAKAEDTDDEADVVQAKAADGGEGTRSLDQSTELLIERGRAGGTPLARADRALLEGRFGHDFSQVRVHTGDHAATAARAVRARAFTLGRDVVFGSGQYAPGTLEGRRLLAHELTHVIQQGFAARTAGAAPVHAAPSGGVQAASVLRCKPGDGGLPEAPDVEPPVEAEDAPTFGLGDAALEAGEVAEGEGTPVERYGVVQTDDGANLWSEPNKGRPLQGLLSLNTKVFVDRKLGEWASVYVEGHQRKQAVPVPQGTHGYVQMSRVATDMPDPDAWLHRITKPDQGALALAAEVYPDAEPDCKVAGHVCRDHRYLVNVLVAVNEAKGRRYIYKQKPSDAWDDAKTMRATEQPGGKLTGGQIWVPGRQLVDAMKDVVSSGSISLETLTTIGDIGIGVAAFVVGLLHGALMSVADVFIGVYDLIKLAGELVVKLFKGTLLADAKGLWDEIKQIKFSQIRDMVDAKWNAPSIWDRWKFRGYVIGYAIVEILMLFFSGGIVTAVKAAAKVGKIGKLAKWLSELGAVKKLISAAKAVEAGTAEKIRGAIKAAEAISEAHSWAAQALRLPLAILRRLSELDIAKLKKLPQWVQERFAMLKDEAKLWWLGCRSPCKVVPQTIIDGMRLATTVGKKLLSPDEVVAALRAVSKDLKLDKISRKLRKGNSALMTAIKEAGLTDADFASLVHFLSAGDASNPAQAYKTFVRYLTNAVPAKIGPDIDKLNKITAAMLKAELGRGAAMKGPMFELWAAMHIPLFAQKKLSRISFDLKKLIRKILPPHTRQVDAWIPDEGVIWEMKHHLGKVPMQQAEDYAKLLGKLAPDGNPVKGVNYLFPTLEAAKANAELAKRFKFGVYFVDASKKAKITKLF